MQCRMHPLQALSDLQRANNLLCCPVEQLNPGLSRTRICVDYYVPASSYEPIQVTYAARFGMEGR